MFGIGLPMIFLGGIANPKTHKPINHKPKDRIPNSESDNRAKDSGSGFLNSGGGPRLPPRGFDIEHHLRDDRDRDSAKAIAKAGGWDFHHLIG